MHVMKKVILGSILISIFAACSPFSRVSKSSKIGAENEYVTLFNGDTKFKSSTFGDFEFALNNKQFKKLIVGKSELKDILFYAKTTEPSYEYYILYNPKSKVFDMNRFVVKDTIINQSNFVLLISKNAPQKDIDFISSKMAKQ